MEEIEIRRSEKQLSMESSASALPEAELPLMDGHRTLRFTKPAAELPHSNRLAVGTGEMRRKGYLQINNRAWGIAGAGETVC